MDKPIIAISIPTGIGAEIGGYAGDFGYIARKFSEKFYTIVNPNAVNGGILSAINDNMAYLEGYLFDELLLGKIGISPLEKNKTNNIGVIFDSSIKKQTLNVHINTLNAMKMVKGAKIKAVEYTENPVEIGLEILNGVSVGYIKKPQELIKSAQKLVSKNVDAIAIVCDFKDDGEDENYSNGCGIDPIGGVEAVISHLIAKEFKIPTAHAPAFNEIDISQKIENPKVASELISSTYLPCIIDGLSVAPKIESVDKAKITYKNIDYLIVPYSAMGSKAVLGAYKNNVKIIAVKNNTMLNVTSEKLNIKQYEIFNTYNECFYSLL